MKNENSFIGTVKIFNGEFGFITSEIGDIFFHKSKINQTNKIDKGDFVSFHTEPSKIKKDTLQAIKVEIIKKSSSLDNIKANELPEYFGEIDWFDNNKGFGIIKYKLGECFVHISNIKSRPTKISEGDICIFNILPSKKDSRKNEAFSVIFLKEHPKSEQLFNKIRFEINKFGKIDDSYKYKWLIKLLSSAGPNIQVDFLGEIEIDEQYKFSMWLENYLDKVNLEMVAEKMLEEHFTFYTNPYQKLFARLNSQTTQLETLSLFLNKLGGIDSSQKYEKIKAVLELNEISDQIKSEFLVSAFTNSDSERKFSFWIDKYVDEINLKTVAEKMLGENTTFYQKLFTNLNSESIQLETLSLFLNKLGCIDSSQKYEKIKAVLELNEIFDQIKSEFLVSAFTNSDSERKFSFWIDKYVDEINLETVAEKMLGENTTLYKKLFICLNSESIQLETLSLFLNKLGCIDSSQKYEKIKAVLELNEIFGQIKSEFLVSAFTNSDNERKFLFWFDNYVDEVNLETVAEKMSMESPKTPYLNPYQKIFIRLSSEPVQSEILGFFLNKLGNIDSPQKYEQVKAVLRLKDIIGQIKNEFLVSAFAKSDTDRKFLLWFDNYVAEVNLETVAEKMLEEKFKTHSEFYQKLFTRLNTEPVQSETLGLFLNKLGNIDSAHKYEKVKLVFGLKEIFDQIKNEFLASAFTISSREQKIIYWYEGLVNEFEEYPSGQVHP